MNVVTFWNIVELSWKDSPDLSAIRDEAIESNDPGLLEQAQKALEERLYHIDRGEIQEYTDGSDDGFLYSRCFIFGMGREYYNMIDDDPSTATMNLEAEIFGFKAYGVYSDLFGEQFERYTVHSIESCSNKEGWKDY